MYNNINLVNNNTERGDFMKMMSKMMWMGAGLGVGMLYKTYEKDITSFMNKQKNKMMKHGCAMDMKNSCQ